MTILQHLVSHILNYLRVLFLLRWDIPTQKIDRVILWVVLIQLALHSPHVFANLELTALSTHQTLIVCLLGALQEFVEVLVPVCIVYVE